MGRLTTVLGMAYHKPHFTQGKLEEEDDTGIEKHLKRDHRQTGA